MNYLIDDVARILAGPTPRRKALKLIGGVLAGSVFGSMFGQAAGNCTGSRLNNSACNDNQQCCGQFCLGGGIGTPGAALCCPNTFVCPPTRCCIANGTSGCCPPGTCGILTPNASATCASVNGATPTGCTTNTALCG